MLAKLIPLRLGVRQRVVLILLTGLLTSLTLGGWFLLHEQSQRVGHEIDRHGMQMARIISRSLVNNVVGYDYHAIQIFLEQITSGSDISYAKVLSNKGNVMAERIHPQAHPGTLRIFENDILLGEAKVGHLSIGINTAEIVNMFEKQKTTLIKRELGIILFIVILEFIALSILIVKPLSAIAAALEQSVGEDGILHKPIEITDNDEFGDIARQFNKMREQLNNAHEALHGKIDLANEKLRDTNRRLIRKSQQLEQTNRELETQAITDPLTGLFNRRKFQILMNTRIAGHLLNHHSFSLLHTDIDHFKSINDKYGHNVGDEVLKETARRLTVAIRKTDILCRIGGEEFVIFCSGANVDDAHNIAEKIRKNIGENTYHIGEHSIDVTTSIGIATPNENSDPDCPECLNRQADIALYESKTRGRNRVTHFLDIDPAQLEDLSDLGIDDERYSA